MTNRSIDEATTLLRPARTRPSAATLLVAACLFASGCGSVTGGQLSSEGAARGSQSVAATSLAVAVSAIRTDILGSVLERSAGEFLAYRDLQEPIRSCMAAAGFTYDPPPFANVYEGLTDADLTEGLQGTGWLSPLTTKSFDLTRTIGLQQTLSEKALAAQPGNNSGYRALSPQRQQQHNSRLSTCSPGARGQQPVEAFPPVALNLADKFDKLVADVEDRPELKAMQPAYRRCLAAAGFTARNPVQLARTAAPTTSLVAPKEGQAVSQDWLAAQSRSMTAADADKRCRASLYAAGVSALARELPRWKNQHQAELDQVRAAWTETTERAQAAH